MQIDTYAAVLKAIDNLSDPTTTLKTVLPVGDNDYGRPDTVEWHLFTAGPTVSGDFNDEHWPIVTHAFARFASAPPSRNVRECCARLAKLTPRG